MNNNNRGSNRRRGRNNNSNRSGGGQRGEQLNRIDSRARGNAPQLLEKYRKLAHDAQLNGDRVTEELYLQFADHYFRVIADSRLRQEEARGRRDERGYEGQGEESAAQSEEYGSEDSAGGYESDRSDYGRNEAGRGENGRSQPRRDDSRRDNPRREQGYRDEPRRNSRPDRDEPRDDMRYNEARESEARYEKADEAHANGRDDDGYADSQPLVAEDAPAVSPLGARRGLRPRRSAAADEMLVQGGLDPSLLPPAISVSDDSEEEAAPRKRAVRRPRKSSDDAALETVNG